MLQFDPLDPQVSQQLQRSRSLFSSAAPPRIVVSAAPTALDAAAAAATSGNPVVVVSAASVSWLKRRNSGLFSTVGKLLECMEYGEG